LTYTAEHKYGRLSDGVGRTVKYLRISVTDRCNYRCRYCTPPEKFTFISHDNVLRYEDIIFAVQTLARFGVEKIRVTGGEPLVRKNLPSFLSRISKINGIKELCVTTNGSLLNKHAEALFDSGVRRLNISLDTLEESRHSFITGGGNLNDVLAGIERAMEIGFSPIKLNAVIIKGFNDDEVIPLCKFAADKGAILRFIEFMPIGNSADWKTDNIITGKQIIDIISKEYTVVKDEKTDGLGPAKYHTLSGGPLIGLITPLSDHFCGRCDKIRLTSDGKFRPCLLSDLEVPAADAIKKRDEAAFLRCVDEALMRKNAEHSVGAEFKKRFARTMSGIGG
jgi:cyclic pyranopterin phosphate synthase